MGLQRQEHASVLQECALSNRKIKYRVRIKYRRILQNHIFTNDQLRGLVVRVSDY